jgi:hypothetical protein
VADLVGLSGQGEYAVVTALAGLVGRGLLVTDSGDDRLLRRHQLLSALEGVAVELPAAAAPTAAQPVDAGPAPSPAPSARVTAPSPRADSPVIPERPEPFTPTRRPDHPEQVPTSVRAQMGGGGNVTALAGHGSVNGATAMQPDAVPAASGLVERDPNVNKSLLLRLIAGVRGL